jgi:hypothetical protein
MSIDPMAFVPHMPQTLLIVLFLLLLIISFLFNLCFQQYAIKENLKVVPSEQQTGFLLKKPWWMLKIIELAIYRA